MEQTCDLVAPDVEVRPCLTFKGFLFNTPTCLIEMGLRFFGLARSMPRDNLIMHLHNYSNYTRHCHDMYAQEILTFKV